MTAAIAIVRKICCDRRTSKGLRRPVRTRPRPKRILHELVRFPPLSEPDIYAYDNMGEWSQEKKVKSVTHHSPPMAPSFFESWLMPAAAEAKLDGSGKGIFAVENSQQ